ncbi:MAG: PAS domain S-box protein [Ignavibacteriaceae bacterium]|nr:PAS domain S-box protein [Ignavibacteriaceae bacterium]
MKPNNAQENQKPTMLVELFGLLAACIGLFAMLGWILGIQFLTNFGSGMIPMAPSTALLFVLLGAAIFLHTHYPQKKIVYNIGITVSVASILASLLLFFFSFTNPYPKIEHLGFSITDTFGNVPIGHMSPLTAVCFVLTGSSLLLALLANAKPKRTLASFWLASLLIIVSVILLSEYLFETPLLYGSNIIPPALTTSLAFLFLGIALIIFTAVQYGWYSRIIEVLNMRTSVVLVLVFVILSVGILTIGYFYFQNYQNQYRKENERQLSLVADMKVSELVRWRHERIIDGSFFYRNYEFSNIVKRYFNNPNDLNAKNQIESLMWHVYDTGEYDALFLSDKKYVKKIVVSKGQESTTSFLSQKSIDSVNTGKVILEDFYYNDKLKKVYLKVLVPIFQEKDDSNIIGIVELRINPEEYLYPYIQKWPTLSKTAETLLLRRDGNNVLFLNGLRFQKNTPLALRSPLTNKKMPAVQAALGYEGMMEGIDYRGIPVLAAIRTIPGSPWSLVARMDIAEIYEPLKEKLWETILLICALLISAGAVIGFMLRNQRIRFYREKHEAAEKLITSELRYRRLFESAKDGVLILDAETGVIVDVNPFLIEMLGYSHEQFLGKTLWEIGFFKDVGTNRDNFLELQQKEYIRYEDLPLKTVDGHQINVEFVSNVYLVDHKKVIQCNIRDITKRKQAEEDLKESENRFRAIFEQAAVGVALLNTKTGQFVRINQKYCDFVGYAMQEMLQKSFLDITFDQDVQTNIDEITQFIEADNREFSYEKRYVHKNGNILWGNLTISPLWKSGEKPETYYHIAIVEDITQRKREELIIQQQNNQLQELNATKDKFLSIIAHDLKSPFQGFLGLTEAMAEGGDDFSKEEMAVFSKEMNKNANNLFKLLQNLLEWAQMQNGTIDFNPEEISLSEIISQNIDLINKRSEQKGIDIIFDVTKNQKVFADEAMLNSVLRNLLSNAVKFTSKGGRVIININETENELIEISIKDSGIGISEEIRKKLFMIGEKVRREGTEGEKSTGLGLLLCKEFVEKNGGKIGWKVSKMLAVLFILQFLRVLARRIFYEENIFALCSCDFITTGKRRFRGKIDFHSTTAKCHFNILTG